MKVIVCKNNKLQTKNVRDLEGYCYVAPDLNLLQKAIELEKPTVVLIDSDLSEKKKKEFVKNLSTVKVGFISIDPDVNTDSIEWVTKDSKNLFFCFENSDKGLIIIHAQCAHKVEIKEKKDHYLVFCPIHRKETELKVYKDVWPTLKKALRKLPINQEIRVVADKKVYFENSIKDEDDNTIHFDTVMREVEKKATLSTFVKKDF